MDSFSALVRPVSAPVPVDWAAVEAWLGLRLPGDYKELADTCGPLDVGDFLWVHVPCSLAGRFDYGTWLREAHRLCRVASRDAGFPVPDGLLAWGATRASSHLFWDTTAAADPDRWPVVVFEMDAAQRGIDPWYDYGLSVTAALTLAVAEGLPLPSGRGLGPLPATARRTAFLADARPWTPPRPEPEVSDARRAALVEGSGLTALRALVVPPERPRLGDRTWDWLAAELGTALPGEFVALMECYGAGSWAGHWLFPPPLAEDGLVAHAAATRRTYRELRDAHPEFYPLGEFLPIAHSIDGDVLAYLTGGGDPDSWPLVVWPRHAGQGPPLPYGLVTTLLEWLRGRFSTAGFIRFDQDDDLVEHAVFRPAR